MIEFYAEIKSLDIIRYRIFGDYYDTSIRNYFINLLHEGEAISNPSEYISLSFELDGCSEIIPLQLCPPFHYSYFVSISKKDHEELSSVFSKKIVDIFNSISMSEVTDRYLNYVSIETVFDLINQHGLPKLSFSKHGIYYHLDVTRIHVNQFHVEFFLGSSVINVSTVCLIKSSYSPSGYIMKNCKLCYDVFDSELMHTGMSIYWIQPIELI